MLKRKLPSSSLPKNNDEDVDDIFTDSLYREKNHIYFYSEIDRDSVSKLNTLLRETEEYCLQLQHQLGIDTVPIYLHIYSDGGEIYAAFTTIDVIERCKVPVYSVIEGGTASAGTLISVVCAKRFIRPHAYMLIHQLRSCLWGKMSEIKDEYESLEHLTKALTSIYEKHTTMPKEKLVKLLQHDKWLSAKKAISYGLADEMYE
jgi:ATP-dependent protease ClpP protease subunit